MTMSSSTVLYVFLIGLCVVSVHGSMHDNEKGMILYECLCCIYNICDVYNRVANLNVMCDEF